MVYLLVQEQNLDETLMLTAVLHFVTLWVFEQGFFKVCKINIVTKNETTIFSKTII